MIVYGDGYHFFLLGIGRACSLALAKEGATVVVNYSRSQGPAEEVVSKINNLDRDESTSGEAIAIKADVSSISAIKQLVTEVVKKYGRIDILVCNAAKLYGNATLENTTEDTFDEAFNLNVKGVYFLIQVSYR
jgi:3-oxoacyl-[acyl-carrier protein] reductase